MKKVYAIAYAFSEELRNMEERQAEFLATDASAWDFDDEDDDNRPYEVVEGIAIYSIKGKMLHESNFFTRIFGITTYEDIGNVLSAMVQDEEVERVLMSMSTPGGHVAGLSDVSETWKQLDAIKPVTVHTAGMLASAGLWLASNSSGGIYASPTAEVGSIGVILQHVSQEKALTKAGIKVTEIKSAPLKAIGSPAKDLSADEKVHLQKKVDEAAQLFKHQIYKTRPAVTEEAFSGETFIASEALKVGLVDGIKSFSEVFSAAMVAAESTFGPGGTDMKKKVTAAMYEAAVASGTDPETLVIVSQDEYDALTAGTGNEGDDDKTQVTQEMFDTAVEDGADPESMEVITQEAFNALENDEGDDAATVEIADLKAQIEDLNTALAATDVTIAGLEADLAAVEEAAKIEPFRTHVLEHLNLMRVALGLQSIDMSEFTNAMINTEYMAISKTFKKAYKAGGHVPAKTGEGVVAPEPVKPPKVTNIEDARLRSASV